MATEETEQKAKSKKKAPPKEPSPFEEGLFRSEKAEQKAIKLLGDRTVAWAHRDGGTFVKFLTMPDGQELRVLDVDE